MSRMFSMAFGFGQTLYWNLTAIIDKTRALEGIFYAAADAELWWNSELIVDKDGIVR